MAVLLMVVNLELVVVRVVVVAMEMIMGSVVEVV